MPNQFDVRVLQFDILQEIEGVRTPQNLASLLDSLEFGDRAGLSDTDLRDACLMALQDLEPEDAARAVLTHDLSDGLRHGQIENMGSDMLDDKLWEEYPEMELHERLFHVGSLLYQAFPVMFPEPDAVRVRLEIRASNDDAAAALSAPLHESLIVRLLADGMDEKSILHRLFEDQLTGKSFPEADQIAWIVRVDRLDARTVAADVTSSGRWLDAVRESETYTSSAFAD